MNESVGVWRFNRREVCHLLSRQIAFVNLFVLTPQEKRVVLFVMLMILLGVCVKEYRKRHFPAPVPIEVQKHASMRKLPSVTSLTPGGSPAVEPSGSATPRPKRSRKPRKRTAPASVAPAEEQPESAASTEDKPRP